MLHFGGFFFSTYLSCSKDPTPNSETANQNFNKFSNFWIVQYTYYHLKIAGNSPKSTYRTHAIITRGLYTFYPLFEVHLCTVTFCLMYGYYSRAVSNQEQLIVARVRYTQ